MKIRLHTNALVHGVQMVQAIADRRTSLQILSSFLLEARDTASARIAATNLQVGLDTAVPALIDRGGVVAIGAKTLYEIIRNFPAREVEIEVDENYWVHVRCGRIHFRIVGASAEGYPDLPAPSRDKAADVATMPAAVLRTLIDRTAFSISPDETRLHLNSALFQGDGRILQMTTTDGHRLTSAKETIAGDGAGYRHELLIAARGITELRKLVDGFEGEIRMLFETPHVFFQRDDTIPVEGQAEPFHATVVLAIKLVDATFPPYRQVIPRDNKRHVYAQRSALADAIRRVSSVSSARTSTVRLRLEQGKVTVSSDNPDIGVGEEEIDVQYDGDALEIGFNSRYLLDAVGAVRGEQVYLNLGEALDGCVVREQDDDRFLGVVMPVRL